MCFTVKSIDDVRWLVVATRGLSGLSDVPLSITKACRRMIGLVETDMAAIALYDGADTLVVAASEGGTALAGIRLPRGSGLGWRALQRSMPATTGKGVPRRSPRARRWLAWLRRRPKRARATTPRAGSGAGRARTSRRIGADREANC
ncbi:hypothetical protein BJF78_14690 [Pseudonocardia sp. CNS-139]|nr:hypothetical protein BJF78_14690 [Pseudonocardia sp. CNS-139]